MSDVEVSRTESLSRAEVARRFAALAEALGDGGRLEVELGGTRVKLHVPDQVRVEIEVEIDGDAIELELELKWSTAPVPVDDAAGPVKTKSGRRKPNSG